MSFFDGDAINALYSALESHALSLNIFRRVNTHEPENAPGEGLSCSILLGPIASDGRYSGLSAVSGTITFQILVFSSMMQKPLDGVDPAILTAVSTLLNAYSGDFTLGGTVRDIDLLALRAEPVYVEQEGKQFRVEQVSLPIVVNDLWTIQESS